VIRERVAKAAGRAQAILKAVVIGSDVQDAASIPGGEDADFASAGAIPPPYDPATLCLLFEHSNALRQNVDAYATNIDAFGYRLEPGVDLEADDADQRVADSILLERLAARDRGLIGPDAPVDPTPEEIAARKDQLAKLARVEKARLENFFEFACFDHSFVDLRRRTRQDLEVTGNAYWEVLRDGAGRVARLVYVPSFSIRLLPIDRDPIEVPERRRVSPVTFETVPTRIRVRKYVQIQDHIRVFFRYPALRVIRRRGSDAARVGRPLDSGRNRAPDNDDRSISGPVRLIARCPHGSTGRASPRYGRQAVAHQVRRSRTSAPVVGSRGNAAAVGGIPSRTSRVSGLPPSRRLAE
jgi:hypothetical protein